MQRNVLFPLNHHENFGWFMTKIWNSSNYKSDPKAFVFSINNQKIYKIIDNKNGNMIYIQIIIMVDALVKELILSIDVNSKPAALYFSPSDNKCKSIPFVILSTLDLENR